MNYNSGNARRNFYAKWDKLREEYRAAGMKEDAIQKMYEYQSLTKEVLANAEKQLKRVAERGR